MSEAALTRAILDELRKLRVWAWRTNSGGVRARNGFFRGAPDGTPDILGVLPGGALFGLEVKSGKGELRHSQISWHETARAHGVRVEVVRSVTRAVAIVMQWREDVLAGVEASLPGRGVL